MTQQSTAVLHAHRLRVATHTGREILRGVSFELFRGDMLGLVGETGAGKTTAGLACLQHLRQGLRHTGGSVMINPVDGTEPFNLFDLDEETMRWLRGRRIAYVPQDPTRSLNPAMRIGDQLTEVLTVHDIPAATHRSRIAQVLNDVDLPTDQAYLRHWPHELPRGEQQRIGIAMAFLLTPDVLILDEPTAGLELAVQARVLDTIRRMTVTHHVASLYITQDLTVAAAISHRLAVMHRGQIVETGATEAVLDSPEQPYTRELVATVPDLAGKNLSFTRFDAIETTPVERAPMVEVKQLCVAYGDHTVLEQINLSTTPGSCTVVLGESGAGKTTLTRALVGLMEPSGGSVKHRGTVLPASMRQRSVAHRQSLQYLFQSPDASLNPRRSIGQSLTVPLEMYGIHDAEQRSTEIDRALASVGLDASVVQHYPAELTALDRQRVAIARALITKPTVLICDEITTELDLSAQAEIIALLNRLRVSCGMTLIWTTHDIALARHVATHIAVLHNGRLVEHGAVDHVLEHPTHDYTRSLLAHVVELQARR